VLSKVEAHAKKNIVGGTSFDFAQDETGGGHVITP
jgi:hypothetical protein